MLLGDVHQSIASWRKLTSINMKPKLALKILRYTKLVTAEADHAEQLRVALIREITGVKEGDIKIEPNTPEMSKYAVGLDKIMSEESDLELLELGFDEIIDAVDEKNESLTVSDLAMLEPFFAVKEELDNA